MNESSNYIDLPQSPPLTDDELWGCDNAADAEATCCPYTGCDCSAWDRQDGCLSRVCVFNLRRYSQAAG